MNDKIRWTKRLGNFLRDVRSELKKVTWPSKNEVVNTTIVVIAATIFFGFYLFFMDIIFSWVLSQVWILFRALDVLAILIQSLLGCCLGDLRISTTSPLLSS